MNIVIFRSPKTGSSAFCGAVHDGTWTQVATLHDFHKQPEHTFCEILGGDVQNSLSCYKEELANCHIVSLMRNPYARFISAWCYSKHPKNKWCPEDISPVEYFEHFADPIRDNIHKCGIYHSFRQQVESLYDLKTGELSVHRVLRQEQLSIDARKLADDTGLSITPLLIKNTTQHDPWLEYYKKFPELKGLVDTCFAEDLMILPYSFNMDIPGGIEELPQVIDPREPMPIPGWAEAGW